MTAERVELGAGYQELLELTRGGMGRVILARRRGAHGFERLVAIKTMRAELREREGMRSMFLDEARLMARLHHPAIAQVHDLIELDGQLCLVMEYVPGVSFALLAALRPPPSVSVEATIAVLRGLHAAHELVDDAGEELGVVHRDVSPQNLMVDFEGRVKILDFGIAWMRRRQTPVTEHGTLKGKPAYMSPEQLASAPINRRTDVYAAAVVLHEMLTGEPLFSGESAFQVAHAMISGKIDPPSARAGVLPAGLDEAVLRGLARDPQQRFGTAAAMAEALEAVMATAGGERLDAYVRRALHAERERHDARLRDADAGAAVARAEPEGRPTGVATAAGDAPAPQAAPDDNDAAPSGAIAPQASELPVPERSRGPLAWIALAAVALTAIAWLALRTAPAREDPNAAAPPVPVESAPAAEPIAELAPPMPGAPPLELASASASAPARAGLAPVPTPVAAPAPAQTSAASGSARPAPSASAASSPVTEFGFLTVGADPYALVQLDGSSIGPTPILARKVPAGPHEVVLVSPDTGAVRLQRRVEIVAGATAQVIAR